MDHYCPLTWDPKYPNLCQDDPCHPSLRSTSDVQEHPQSLQTPEIER